MQVTPAPLPPSSPLLPLLPTLAASPVPNTCSPNPKPLDLLPSQGDICAFSLHGCTAIVNAANTEVRAHDRRLMMMAVVFGCIRLLRIADSVYSSASLSSAYYPANRFNSAAASQVQPSAFPHCVSVTSRRCHRTRN